MNDVKDVENKMTKPSHTEKEESFWLLTSSDDRFGQSTTHTANNNIYRKKKIKMRERNHLTIFFFWVV